MIQQLTLGDFLALSRQHLTIDVRSEGEFNHGHIPHAINLPLFTNEERKIVGTIYKQQSKNEAILSGLDIVGKKMAGFVRFVQPLIKDNKVFVHCWRGGMRSGSMAWLLNLFGYEVYVLSGGYKAYRRYVLETFLAKFNFKVIGGYTGSGKTEVLQHLKQQGEQAIDLEALANHKGSAFGALGQMPQPAAEHFENLLAEELRKLNAHQTIWLEDESRTIGKVFLDINFWNQLRFAPLYVLQIPLQRRLAKLIEQYGHFNPEDLKTAFGNITKRLGNEQWKNALAALDEGNMETAAKIALYYYDKAYDKGIAMKETKEIIKLQASGDDMCSIAKQLINAANKL